MKNKKKFVPRWAVYVVFWRTSEHDENFEWFADKTDAIKLLIESVLDEYFETVGYTSLLVEKDIEEDDLVSFIHKHLYE